MATQKLRWKRVQGCGYVSVKDDLVDSKGTRITRKLLSGTVRSFARRVRAFDDAVKQAGNYPFAWREKQIHSILLPALSKNSTMLFSEQRVERGRGKTAKRGYLDYWILHRDVLILLEIEQGYQKLPIGTINANIQKKWSEAKRQINDFSSKRLKDELEIKPSKTFRAMLMILILFREAEKERELKKPLSRDRVVEPFEQMLKHVRPTPNWSALWSLSRRFQDPVGQDEGNRFEAYPAIMFFSHVHIRGDHF